MMLVPWLRDSRLAETTLTLALPYLVYIARASATSRSRA